jgi:hypothetical protein
MKIWIVAALAAVLASGGVTPALAQAAPAPGAAKVSPRSAELVRRMYRAVHIDTTMDAMMASMMPAMTEEMTRRTPGITDEQRRLINEVVQDVMHDATPKILDRLIPAYAATFTDEELKAVVDFYESPAGVAIVTKMPLMAPRTAELMREMMPEIETEMVTRFCAKVNCNVTPARTPKRS